MTQPPEVRRPEPPDTGGGLTSKVGPLPVWGWVAIAAAGGIAVLLWLQNRKSSASTAAQSDNTASTISPDTADVQNLQDEMQVVLAQIRDLQGGNSTPTTPATGGTTAPTAPAKVLAGWSVYQFLNDINTGLEQQGSSLRVTYQDLLAFNPNIANSIDSSDPAKPKFKSNMSVNLFAPTAATVAQ